MNLPGGRSLDGQLVWDPRRSIVLIVVSLIVAVAAIVTIRLMVDWEVQAPRVTATVQGLGPAAPLLFMAAMAVGIVVCVPIVITVGIGSLAFGHLGGALYSLAGLVVGTAGAFLIGRYALRRFGTWILDRRVPVFRVLASRRGPLAALGLRLVFPFAPAVDYAVGATAMSLRDYLLGSLVALLPRIFALSFFFDLVTRSDWLAITSSVPALLVLLLMSLLRGLGLVVLTRLVRQSTIQGATTVGHGTAGRLRSRPTSSSV